MELSHFAKLWWVVVRCRYWAGNKKSGSVYKKIKLARRPSLLSIAATRPADRDTLPKTFEFRNSVARATKTPITSVRRHLSDKWFEASLSISKSMCCLLVETWTYSLLLAAAQDGPSQSARPLLQRNPSPNVAVYAQGPPFTSYMWDMWKKRERHYCNGVQGHFEALWFGLAGRWRGMRTAAFLVATAASNSFTFTVAPCPVIAW